MKKVLYVTYLIGLVVISYFLYDVYMFANYEVPGDCYASNWRGQVTLEWLSYTIVVFILILTSTWLYKLVSKNRNEKLRFFILAMTGILILLGTSFLFVKPLMGQPISSVCTSKGSY